MDAIDSVSAIDGPSAPGYRTLRKIGEGGMGEIYLAQPDRGSAYVAIKFLSPLPAGNTEEQKLRFRRESQIVAGLTHPNIVSILEHGCTAGRDYLVMEYVDGSSLRAHLTPNQPKDPSESLAVLDGIAQALEYLSEQGVIHRDLKPENVLLDNQGRVKVTDFGISARTTDVGLYTRTGQILGTVDYMAPEQRARLPVDERADQYAMAVIAYEMLTGKRPLGRFKPASQLNPRVHPDVDEVLSRALHEDADDRYPTIQEFHSALAKSLGLAPRAKIATRRPVFAALVTLAALVGAGAYAIGINRPEEPAPTPGGEDVAVIVAPVGPAAEPSPRPKDAAAFLDMAEKHLAAGRRREAETCYTEAHNLAPANTDILLKRAFLFKLMRAHQKALDDLDAALRIDAELADAYTGKGSIYVQLQDYAKALPELDKAIELGPELPEAYAYRGYARYNLKQVKEGRADLDEAIRIDSDCGVAYQFRGIVANSQEDFEAAIQSFEHAIRCMPGNPFVHSSLATVLATAKDVSLRDADRALVHAKKACELTNYKEFAHLRSLASSHAAKGDLDAAIHWCEKALEATPAASQSKVKRQLAEYQKRRGAQEGQKK